VSQQAEKSGKHSGYYGPLARLCGHPLGNIADCTLKVSEFP